MCYIRDTKEREPRGKGKAGRKECPMQQHKQTKAVIKVTVTKTIKIEVIRAEDKKTACKCCNTCKR